MNVRQTSRDGGFTLPEVLISIIILGTITAVLATVVSVVLRNTPSAEARAEDARSVMGLVTWLPQDVDSTPPNGFDDDPLAVTGCGIDPDGVTRWSLLRMEWSERTSAGTSRHIAAYHYVQSDGAGRLQRVTCGGMGSPPFANGGSQNLTADLPPLPAGWVPGQPPVAFEIVRDLVSGAVVNVNVALTMNDGDVVNIDAAPKNPAATLPSTTLPSWYPPAPATSVFVNTAPTFHDQALTAHPSVVTQAKLVAYDIDGDPLALTIATAPAGWGVSLSGDVLSITPSVPASYPSTQIIEILVDDQAGGVTPGTVEVTVVDAATTPTTTSTSTTTSTLPSTTPTTLPPCAILSASVSPTPVKNVQPDSSNQGGGNVNIGVLFKAVTISATTNEYCGGLEVRYDSGGVNTPPQVGMVQTAPNTWSVVIPGRDEGSSETWADGDRAIRFFDADGGPWGSVILKVN